MRQRLSYVLIIAVAFTVASCMSGKGMRAPAARKSDSTAYATQEWRQFFGDSILTALIDTALAASPDMLTAVERLNIASAELSARHFALFPRADARVALGQRRFGAYTMDGVGNYDTKFSPNINRDQVIPEHLPDFFWGVQGSWEIDIWSKVRSSREAARARFFQQDDARRMVVSNLVAAVASTYYELLSLDNEMEILDEFIGLQENAEQIISYQKIAGQATELAVQQFSAQTLNSRNLRVETRQKIAEAENRMSYLLGRLPGPVPRNRRAFDDSLQSLPVSIPPALLRNRPDVARAENAMKEARMNVAAARASFYPALTLDALVGFQTFNPKFVFSPASITYNIIGALTAPLINRAALTTSLRIANSRQRMALYDYRKAAYKAYAEVATELSHLRNLREMYDLKNREAEASFNAVEIANALFRTGRATYLEVIITQKNALLTRLALVNLKERKLKSAIALYKALGGGWR